MSLFIFPYSSPLVAFMRRLLLGRVECNNQTWLIIDEHNVSFPRWLLAVTA